jgi:hypothetical protein
MLLSEFMNGPWNHSGKIRKSQEQPQDGYCWASERREIFAFQSSVRGLMKGIIFAMNDVLKMI